MAVKVKEKIKGSKVWWVFINHHGRRRSASVGDKSAALELAKKLEAKLTLGDFNLASKKAEKLFGEYSKIFIELIAPSFLKPSTITDYRVILNKHVAPQFNKLPVTQISRLKIKSFLAEKSGAGLSVSTIKHIKYAISNVLNLAIDDKIIEFNPCHRMGQITRKKTLKLDINPLNREELSLLLETFRLHFSKHYPLILTLARTGMRIGEAMALQWGDIDFNGRFIHVQRGLSRGKVETPKNGKSRKVDVSMQLKAVLLDLKHQRKVETVKKGVGNMPDWVFISTTGDFIDAANWRKRVFNRALDKAGLRKIHPHVLRHTYASLLIQANESLTYIRDQLGHHSINVTVDTYGHLAPEGNKQAVDRLDDTPIRTLYAPCKNQEVS